MLFSRLKIWLLIVSSFFVALMLMCLYLPGWGKWVYPPWLVLVVLYWALLMPQHINVGVAWFVGFFLDILYNTPVGENALALVFVVYFLVSFSDKIVLFGFLKRASLFFCLVFATQLLPMLMQSCLGVCGNNFWNILSTSVVGTFVLLLVVEPFNKKRKFLF